jgi:4-hydroxybenzoate polyprenyltransferase
MRQLLQIWQITRAKDWRLSLMPFVIGCIYLWIGWFRLELTAQSFLVFVMSFVTTVGFAALGYFLNEFFDKKIDAIAGKMNTLARMPVLQQTLIFFACAACALLPWLFLPADKFSYLLICLEIALFLLYSLPFPRLKGVLFLSSITDAGYAYVVPLVLTFYTYSLFGGASDLEIIILLVPAVFVIGFRNITIHHINDIAKDQRSKNVTLPQVLGVQKTAYLVIWLMACEILLFSLWSISAALHYPIFWLWVVLYAGFLIYRLRALKPWPSIPFFTIEPIRHLTDPVYQYLFPAFTLFFIVLLDYKWLVFAPLHLALLVPRHFVVYGISRSVSFIYGVKRAIRNWIMVPAGWTVNYLIYFSFLLFGVNLQREGTSAMSFLRKKFFHH